MRRLIVPILLAVVLSVLLIAFFESTPLTPPLASRQGRPVDTLMRAMFMIAPIVFSLVLSFIVDLRYCSSLAAITSCRLASHRTSKWEIDSWWIWSSRTMNPWQSSPRYGNLR